MSQGQGPTNKVSKGTVYDVVIAGVPLKLRSGHDSKTVKQLVSFVDNKVQQALPATKSGSVQNAALLAALNMAEELFELKAKALVQLEKVEKKAQKTLHELESTRSPRAALDN
jgi:cell division protein ZapA